MEDVLAAIQSKVKSDAGFKGQIQGAKSVQDFVDICNQNGFHITQAALMKSQAERILQLSDAELESAHINAAFYSTDTIAGCLTWALTCTCPCN